MIDQSTPYSRWNMSKCAKTHAFIHVFRMSLSRCDTPIHIRWEKGVCGMESRKGRVRKEGILEGRGNRK